jgi:hypothetical protein
MLPRPYCPYIQEYDTNRENYGGRRDVHGSRVVMGRISTADPKASMNYLLPGGFGDSGDVTKLSASSSESTLETFPEGL